MSRLKNINSSERPDMMEEAEHSASTPLNRSHTYAPAAADGAEEPAVNSLTLSGSPDESSSPTVLSSQFGVIGSPPQPKRFHDPTFDSDVPSGTDYLSRIRSSLGTLPDDPNAALLQPGLRNEEDENGHHGGCFSGASASFERLLQLLLIPGTAELPFDKRQKIAKSSNRHPILPPSRAIETWVPDNDDDGSESTDGYSVAPTDLMSRDGDSEASQDRRALALKVTRGLQRAILTVGVLDGAAILVAVTLLPVAFAQVGWPYLLLIFGLILPVSINNALALRTMMAAHNTQLSTAPKQGPDAAEATVVLWATSLSEVVSVLLGPRCASAFSALTELQNVAAAVLAAAVSLPLVSSVFYWPSMSSPSFLPVQFLAICLVITLMLVSLIATGSPHNTGFVRILLPLMLVANLVWNVANAASVDVDATVESAEAGGGLVPVGGPLSGFAHALQQRGGAADALKAVLGAMAVAVWLVAPSVRIPRQSVTQAMVMDVPSRGRPRLSNEAFRASGERLAGVVVTSALLLTVAAFLQAGARLAGADSALASFSLASGVAFPAESGHAPLLAGSGDDIIAASRVIAAVFATLAITTLLGNVFQLTHIIVSIMWSRFGSGAAEGSGAAFLADRQRQSAMQRALRATAADVNSPTSRGSDALMHAELLEEGSSSNLVPQLPKKQSWWRCCCRCFASKEEGDDDPTNVRVPAGSIDPFATRTAALSALSYDRFHARRQRHARTRWSLAQLASRVGLRAPLCIAIVFAASWVLTPRDADVTIQHTDSSGEIIGNSTAPFWSTAAWKAAMHDQGDGALWQLSFPSLHRLFDAAVVIGGLLVAPVALLFPATLVLARERVRRRYVAAQQRTATGGGSSPLASTSPARASNASHDSRLVGERAPLLDAQPRGDRAGSVLTVSTPGTSNNHFALNNSSSLASSFQQQPVTPPAAAAATTPVPPMMQPSTSLLVSGLLGLLVGAAAVGGAVWVAIDLIQS